MNKPAKRVEVEVEELKDSAPAASGAGVVLHTDARVNGKLHDTTIQVGEDDTPEVVVALLNGDAPHAGDGDLPEPVRCLAVGVIHAASAGNVRLHLQFASGQVLPIEMSIAAAKALHRGLGQHPATAS